MSRKPGNAFIVALLAVFTIITAAIAFVFVYIHKNPQKFELDKKYYGAVEVMDIDTEEFNRLIRRGANFVVVTDTPGCTITTKLRENFEALPENRQIKYYHIYWQDTKDTKLREAVRFAPSIAIIKSGEIIASLGADNDEDAAAFNDSAELAKWLEQYISFP